MPFDASTSTAENNPLSKQIDACLSLLALSDAISQPSSTAQALLEMCRGCVQADPSVIAAVAEVVQMTRGLLNQADSPNMPELNSDPFAYAHRLRYAAFGPPHEEPISSLFQIVGKTVYIPGSVEHVIFGRVEKLHLKTGMVEVFSAEIVDNGLPLGVFNAIRRVCHISEIQHLNPRLLSNCSVNAQETMESYKI